MFSGNRALRFYLLIAVTGCGLVLSVLIFAIRAPKPRTSTPDERQLTIARISICSAACADYRKITGQWPTSLLQLTTLVPIRSSEIFTDGWNRSILLITHSNVSNQIWLESYGADGRFGGVGTNADVVMELK